MEAIFKLLKKYEGVSMSCMYFDDKLVVKIESEKKFVHHVFSEKEIKLVYNDTYIVVLESLIKSVIEGGNSD